MGGQTVQRIRQRRMVCCTSATAGTDFTHHEQSQKESIDGVRRLSSLLLRSSATRKKVELCEEANKTDEDNNMCARRRVGVYGTQAAAQNWHKKVQETMATLGFTIGKASPVLFCHPREV